MNIQSTVPLCSKCKWGAGCAIPAESGEPVVTCGSYEGLQLPAPENAKRTSDISLRDLGRLHGICVDCANRRSCLFFQLEGGVWHCEEYR